MILNVLSELLGLLLLSYPMSMNGCLISFMCGYEIK